MLKILSTVGELIFSPFTYAFSILLNTYNTLKSPLLERHHGKRLIFQSTSLQVYFTAIQALPIILMAGLILGTATIAELVTILPKFGAGKYVERLTVITLIRELIPIITALIIIGRSGTAMATELGNMKLNREIELIDSLGINTDYFLVLPRLVGTIISIICLTVIFNVVAIGGGLLFAKIFISSARRITFSQLISSITLYDLSISFVKSTLFGWVIAIINCGQGLSVNKSFTEVPQVTTRGVVNSIIFCFILSIFISLYLFPSFEI